MNREEAAELVKQCPLPKHYDSILSGIGVYNDEEVSVTLDGLIDRGLEIRLVAAIKGDVSLHRHRCFRPAGTLSALEDKLFVASALGLISADLEGDIDALHTIRLMLADARELKLTFDSPSIWQEIGSTRLQCLVPRDRLARSQYISIVRLCFAVLAAGRDL